MGTLLGVHPIVPWNCVAHCSIKFQSIRTQDAMARANLPKNPVHHIEEFSRYRGLASICKKPNKHQVNSFFQTASSTDSRTFVNFQNSSSAKSSLTNFLCISFKHQHAKVAKNLNLAPSHPLDTSTYSCSCCSSSLVGGSQCGWLRCLRWYRHWWCS